MRADYWSPVFRRGGRAVDRAGLENRKAERPREFESHPLRHLSFEFRLAIVDLQQKHVRYKNGRKNSKDYTAHNIGQIMRPEIDARETNQDRDRQTGDSNPPVREK